MSKCFVDGHFSFGCGQYSQHFFRSSTLKFLFVRGARIVELWNWKFLFVVHLGELFKHCALNIKLWMWVLKSLSEMDIWTSSSGKSAAPIVLNCSGWDIGSASIAVHRAVTRIVQWDYSQSSHPNFVLSKKHENIDWWLSKPSFFLEIKNWWGTMFLKKLESFRRGRY